MTTWSDTRAAALDTAMQWIRHWQSTTGVAHDDARVEAQAAIAYLRQYHIAPEQAAFRAAAVARSKQRARRAA